MERHLTVSGFVVHEGRVALHWHRKLGAWLPPDGGPEPEPGHVDLVYFLHLADGSPGRSHDPANPVVWLDAPALAAGAAPQNGALVPFPPDVQALAPAAIRHAAKAARPSRASGRA